MKLKTLAKLTLTVLAAAALCLAVSAKEPVSVGKPVTVSSFQSGNIASNINDGDDDTRWCASDSVYPQEIVIDLEGWYDLSDADIYFHRPDWDKDRHYSFKLFGSSDGESYSLLDGGDFSANESTERRLVFTLTGTARYVKLEMYSCSSSSGWATVDEITLYGTPAANSGVTVAEAETLPDVTVDFGTPFLSLALPEKVSVKLSNGAILEAGLSWDSSEYDPEKSGEQVLTATFTGLPAGVAAGEVSVTKKVSVRSSDYKPPVSVREKLPINDGWKFHDGNVSSAASAIFDDSDWESVTLPHTGDAYSGLGDKEFVRGTDWYRKVLFVPEEKYSGRIYLEFDAAYSATTVYVNGTQAGDTHYGGYTRFRYDITDAVNFGADNIIAVKVDSNLNSVPPVSGDFTKFGGITGDVYVIYANPVHAELLDYGSPGVFFTPERIGETDSWRLSVTSDIVNDGNEEKTLTVKTVLRDVSSFDPIPGIPESLTPFDESTMFGDRIYAESEKALTVAPGEKAAFSDVLDVSSPRLWDGINDPFRYEAVLEIYDGDTLIDSVEQKIGFRYFSVDPDEGFFLNGKKYPLRGVGYHEDYIGAGSAMTDEMWDESFAMVYELGATVSRLVHYPHDEYSYELCDRYGIVVWTELSQISWLDENDAKYFERTPESLKELIRQQKNRPSVCFWGIQNEVGVGKNTEWSDATDDFMNSLVALAKSEDPTRLTVQASCNWDICGKEWLTDLIAINTYPLWYSNGNLGDIVDSYIQNNLNNPSYTYWNGKPVGVSEYGAGSSIFHHSDFPTAPVPSGKFHPEEWASVAHESAIHEINKRDNLWMTAIWCMFDFASNGRNEGDSAGINDKGLVTRDRKTKKDAFYLYKANWMSAERDPFVYITSRRMTEREVASNTITVYSNMQSVELFRNGVSLGEMTSVGDGIFRTENVSYGEIGDETTLTAKCGDVTDSISFTRRASSSLEFDIVADGIYINENDGTVLFSRNTNAENISDCFRTNYNAVFSVIGIDHATTVESGLIKPGMILRITSEDGKASRDYNVIATSIARGKPVTASSESGNNRASGAVDGVISSDSGFKWDGSSAAPDFPSAWLMIDLEKEYTLTKTKIYFFPGWGGTRAYKYNIYVGTTKDSLEKVVDRTQNTEIGEIDDLLGNIKGRYVKIEIITNSDYESGNSSALPSILEAEINGYNLLSDTAVFDHELKTVTIPSGEVMPSELLSQIKVDGNALLSIEAPAYYLMAGDKLIVTDYAGGRTVYTVRFSEGKTYVRADSVSDIDAASKDKVIYVVKKSDADLCKYLTDGGFTLAYLGDADTDGTLDAEDLRAYLRALCGATSLDTTLCDIDGDGRVGLSDLRALAKMLED